jgi:uncharacterized protein (AIM24 family)
MGRYTMESFQKHSVQKDRHEGVFELETDRFLEVHLDGMMWTKKGSMVSYLGNITFTREGILEHGVGKFLKKMFTTEGMQLTKAEGKGVLYLADYGKKVTILQMDDDEICINGNDILAFEPTLEWDIKMLKSIAGMLSGGIFNVRLEGTGMVAFTSHYDPLTLPVYKDRPVYTDPNATIAWSGTLPGRATWSRN